MFQKLVAKLFIATLALALLVGCASPTTAPTEAPKPVATEASSAAQPATPGCDPNQKYRVALVIGLLGDKSFLDSAAAGFKMINETFKNVETKIIENADVGEQQLAEDAAWIKILSCKDDRTQCTVFGPILQNQFWTS